MAKTPKQDLEAAVGFVLLVFITIGIGSLFFSNSDQSKSQSKNKDTVALFGEACLKAQDGVLENLLSPISAEFPSCVWGISKYQVYESHDEKIMLIGSYVDAKNAFGVPLRQNWFVKLTRNSNLDPWNINNVVLGDDASLAAGLHELGELMVYDAPKNPAPSSSKESSPKAKINSVDILDQKSFVNKFGGSMGQRTATCMFINSKLYKIPPSILLSIYQISGGKTGIEITEDNGRHLLGTMNLNAILIPQMAGLWKSSEADARKWMKDYPCVNTAITSWLLRASLDRGDTLVKSLVLYGQKQGFDGDEFERHIEQVERSYLVQ